MRLALRIVGRRPPAAPILVVMRAAVVFLCAGAFVAGSLVLILGGGSGTPRLDDLGAQLLLFAGIGAAALVISLRGREPADDRSPGHLAVWAFRTTLQQVMAAAAIGPLGVLLTWLAADPVWVIYGTGVAILMMAVVAPTARRVAHWQEEIDAPIDVMAALMAPYR